MFSTLILYSVFLLEIFSKNGIEASPSNIQQRIIGGADSFIGQFPFAAAINVETLDGRYFCGGALLNHNWVLTAGHCVYNARRFTIQLGSNKLNDNDPDRVSVTTNDYVLHPDFDYDTIENDIGLIKLRASVPYTDYVQPINLPSVNLLNNTIVTAMGWGQISDAESGLSDTLQYISAYVLSNLECQQFYGDAITDTMACIEGNLNEGTCVGDNGGPLVEYLSRRYWIVGVASFISGNGCEGPEPSGYTRTFPYQQWIMDIAY